ncbi:MAG: hypothetical protein ACLUFP_05645 [Streptococcus salivarius]
MTKADWLDFFEAINGRSATEEEIAAALAAGEFQDDAPAVETAPTRSASASATTTDFRECPEAQPQLNFRWCPRSATTADFASAKTRQPSSFAMLRQQAQPTFAGAQLLQYKECQIKQRNHKLVLRMLKLVLLTVNLFNQVKTFNLSMDKP